MVRVKPTMKKSFDITAANAHNPTAPSSTRSVLDVLVVAEFAKAMPRFAVERSARPKQRNRRIRPCAPTSITWVKGLGHELGHTFVGIREFPRAAPLGKPTGPAPYRLTPAGRRKERMARSVAPTRQFHCSAAPWSKQLGSCRILPLTFWGISARHLRGHSERVARSRNRSIRFPRCASLNAPRASALVYRLSDRKRQGPPGRKAECPVI